MPTSLYFLSQPPFYFLLLLGCAAMIPRARFAAQRAAALTPEQAAMLRPNFAQRISLFLPGACLLIAVMALGYTLGAVVLLTVYLAAYAVLIVMFRSSLMR